MRSGKRTGVLGFFLILSLGWANVGPLASTAAGAETADADEAEEEVAKIKVRGYGLFGNRSLRRTLEMLRDPDAPQSYLTATQIEDAAMLLLAQIQQDGYLQPEVEARVRLSDGQGETFVWDEDSMTLLPRPMKATEVEFRIRPGDLFYYESIEFEGLNVIEEEEAKEFFVSTGFLFETRGSREFTPSGLESGLRNLREVLVRRGYEQARVVVSRLDRDDETGEVRVGLSVDEGPQSIIRQARAVITMEGTREDRQLEVPDEQPYTPTWVQDQAQAFRREFYELGYPDAEVESEVVERVRAEGRVFLDLVFRVDTGPYVEVGEIRFVGQERTLEKIMRRRIDLDSGEPLNRVKVDEGRTRLARLGVFEWVEAEIQNGDGTTRDIVFRVEEGPEIDVNLLFGYGSYELFRLGLEVEQYNLFGRAHRSRLLLAQSVKSSSVDYRYTVPELFGEDVNGFGSAYWLRREEIDFDRREFGTTVGLQTLFYRLDLDAGLRYSFQLLESRAGIPSGLDGLDRAVVGAVDLTLQRDLRDNPIYPERGHNVVTNFEVASDAFGGEVDYQRGEISASYHKEIGGGRFIHVGFRHGVIYTSGRVEEELPVNKRFLTGGESSVRGFIEGEASSRNEAGELVGSESYALLNLEIEQALTERWSVVAFSDLIGIARRFDDYPFDETLHSVGLGIRFKTFIGPIRLEYGHNLNPRPLDPDGTLHLSIGFPF